MTCTCAKKKLETSIRLRRGWDPRALRVLIASPLEEPDRIAPARVFDAFLAAAEEGLFGGTVVSDVARETRLFREHGLMTDVLWVTFSALPPSSFAPLVHMVAASVPGAVRLEIHEQHRDERTLVARALERDTEPTLLDVDWEIAFAPSEPARIVVRFREPPSTAILERLSRLLRVWIEAVSLGAFPPSGGGGAAAMLRQLAPGDAQEVVAEFDRLECAYDAFEALFDALDRLHQQHAIEHVVVPCRGHARRAADSMSPRSVHPRTAGSPTTTGDCQ